MVKFEIWNNTRFTTEKRENLKFKEAVDVLKTLLKHKNTFKNFDIKTVDIYCPYTENRVYVRTTGKYNYHFKFTNKQMKKVNDLLVELNNSNELNHCWY